MLKQKELNQCKTCALGWVKHYYVQQLADMLLYEIPKDKLRTVRYDRTTDKAVIEYPPYKYEPLQFGLLSSLLFQNIFSLFNLSKDGSMDFFDVFVITWAFKEKQTNDNFMDRFEFISLAFK